MCGVVALITSFANCSVARVMMCEIMEATISDAAWLFSRNVMARIASFAGRGTAGRCVIWWRAADMLCRSMGQSGVLSRWCVR